MDWTQVILAGLGGGLGAALGSLLAVPFSSKSTKSTIAVIAVVIGSSLGGKFGPQLAEPYLGPLLRDATGQTADVESQLATLKGDPFFAALLAAKPDLEPQIKARLVEAYRKGGADGLKREAGLIGSEYGGTIFSTYAPCAKSDDLKEVFTAVTDIADELTKSDPELCYVWLFGTKIGKTFDSVEFSRSVGSAREKHLASGLVAMIKNAAPAPIAYDRKAAQQGVKRAAEAMAAQLGQQNLPLLTLERVATTTDEQRLVCAATATLYKAALAEPNSGDVLRAILTQP
jgi:hypothetical protein